MEYKNNRIILDTDPGIDDAVALAVLLHARREQVKLVLTTYGNTSLDNATRNALTLLSLMDANIPVVRGASAPGPGNSAYEDAAHVHGSDGLVGLQDAASCDQVSNLLADLPQTEAIDGDYLRILYEAVMEEGQADYIALGPLTNLAGLIKQYPDVAQHINRVVVMGGGIEMGNVTPHAEFNIYCDAESAGVVFNAIRDITLVPLDVTMLVAYDLPGIAKVGAAGTRVASVMEFIMRVNHDLCVARGEPGAVMHDATAVLAYLHPDWFEFRECGITVECEKDHYGKCIMAQSGVLNVRLTTGFRPGVASPARLLDEITKSISSF